jgi:hypothetical protein
MNVADKLNSEVPVKLDQNVRFFVSVFVMQGNKRLSSDWLLQAMCPQVLGVSDGVSKPDKLPHHVILSVVRVHLCDSCNYRNADISTRTRIAYRHSATKKRRNMFCVLMRWCH